MPKLKKKEFRFSFQVFIRLLLFAAIMYLSISYLSKNNQSITSDPTVLGTEDSNLKNITDTIYQQLPPQSQQMLENIDKSPPATFIQDKINYIKSQSGGFPQKQLAEIKKTIIKNILQGYLDGMDNK